MSQILVPGVEFCQEGVVGLGHGGESWFSAPVGFHGCCPEQRQGPAQLRVLRNSPRAMPLFGYELVRQELTCKESALLCFH